MDNLPYELHYKIISNLRDRDCISYCIINRVTQSICNDHRFWIEKLDRELSYIDDDDGILHKPSEYIVAYKHNDEGIKMYERWYVWVGRIYEYKSWCHMYIKYREFTLSKNCQLDAKRRCYEFCPYKYGNDTLIWNMQRYHKQMTRSKYACIIDDFIVSEM